jgi:hypothetical protein
MLKKTCLAYFILTAFILPAGAQDIEPARIVVYRPPNYLSPLTVFNVYANNTLIAGMKNNSFYEYFCQPGEYVISTGENQFSSLNLYAAEGQSYYIRMGMQMRLWGAVPELVLVNPEWANQEISRTSMRQIQEDKAVAKKFKNRMGLNMNMGYGFEQITMAYLSNGQQSSISFGGGFEMGLNYGYQIHKYLDLSVDLAFALNFLAPTLINGEVLFSRGKVGITPSLVLPFRGRDFMQFKIGAGLNYQIAPEMEIDLSALQGGYQAKGKYENAFGYHFNLAYEMHYSSRFSVGFGLRYTDVKYKLRSSDADFPTSIQFKNPNGHSVDLLTNLLFRF